MSILLPVRCCTCRSCRANGRAHARSGTRGQGSVPAICTRIVSVIRAGTGRGRLTEKVTGLLSRFAGCKLSTFRTRARIIHRSDDAIPVGVPRCKQLRRLAATRLRMPAVRASGPGRSRRRRARQDHRRLLVEPEPAVADLPEISVRLAGLTGFVVENGKLGLPKPSAS